MQGTVMQPFTRTFSFVQKLKLVLQYLVVGGIAVVMGSTFIACEFNPKASGPFSDEVDFNDGQWIPEEINIVAQSAPLTTPTSELPLGQVLNGDSLDDPVFRSYHGHSCAQGQRAWTKDANGKDRIGFRTKHSLPLAPGMDYGMVFLNGWKMKYEGNTDHHVRGLGTWIFNVSSHGGVLRWEAASVLTDVNGDDAFEGCYHYTVVTWDRNTSSAPIEAYVLQDDFLHDKTFVHPQGQTAGLRVLSGEFHYPAAKAIVPRGYGFMWGGNEDHHLLQIAFDLDASVWRNQNSISWDSAMIFKDNSTRSFIGAEMVSVLGDPGVDIVRRPLFIAPRVPSSCPSVNLPESRSVWVAVPNLTYDYAVPVLAGFNIGDVCDDNHVKEVGAWIDTWYYEKNPGNPTGTLHYQVSSIFKDQDGLPGMAIPQYKVNILGFNRGPYVPDGGDSGKTPGLGW